MITRHSLRPMRPPQVRGARSAAAAAALTAEKAHEPLERDARGARLTCGLAEPLGDVRVTYTGRGRGDLSMGMGD